MMAEINGFLGRENEVAGQKIGKRVGLVVGFAVLGCAAIAVATSTAPLANLFVMLGSAGIYGATEASSRRKKDFGDSALISLIAFANLFCAATLFSFLALRALPLITTPALVTSLAAWLELGTTLLPIGLLGYGLAKESSDKGFLHRTFTHINMFITVSCIMLGKKIGKWLDSSPEVSVENGVNSVVDAVEPVTEAASSYCSILARRLGLSRASNPAPASAQRQRQVAQGSSSRASAHNDNVAEHSSASSSPGRRP